MELKISERAQPRWAKAGKAPILIIDDVLDNADELREQALALRFEPPQNGSYPGLKAAASVRGGVTIAKMLAQAFLSQRHGSDVPAMLKDAKPKVATDFSILSISQEAASDPRFSEQHVDTATWLASVIYLFGEPGVETPERGTAFWRHRPTGLTCFSQGDSPDSVELVLKEKLLGFPLMQELPDALTKIPATCMNLLNARVFKQVDRGRRPLSMEESDTWELLYAAPAKFNRLVCYPSWFIHSALETPDDTPTVDTARLTMNCFVLSPFRTMEEIVAPQAETVLSIPGICEE